MLSGRDDLGESRMREICMSGSTREREAAVFGLCASHSVLSSLLYRFILFAIEGCSTRNTSKQLRRTSGSQRLGSAAAICRLRAPMQHGRGVPAAIQQSLQQWI